MSYLRYYSKVRQTLNGNIEKEIEYAKGRIVTKVIDDGALFRVEYKKKQKITKEVCALYEVAQKKFTKSTLSSMYTEFKIPKRSGGMRTLHAPNDELKAYQKQVQKFFENTCKLLPDNAVHSYVKHRNCKTAMQVHQKNKSRWFLKLDIKNFFDNITIEVLFNVLNNIEPIASYVNETILEEILYPCFLNNALPQGSPASPVLSNLYLSEFDYALKSTLGKDFCYTRYADDILISSRKSFGFMEVVNKINELLRVYGLEVNKTKTRYGSCNGANWNLGLMYNQDLGITVGHRHKHIIKCMIHNLYSNRENTPDWFTKQAQLLGLLNYYKFIEPDYFNPLIEKYKEKGYLQ